MSVRLRRWILYIAAAGALVLAGEMPFQQSDVGRLLPVETSLFYIEDGQVCLETDLGLRGRGADLESALADLERSAPGVVFYDTGNYILLHGSAAGLLPELTELPRLRGSCVLCRTAERDLDLTAAGEYLEAHDPGFTLRQAEAALAAGMAAVPPELVWREEEFILASEGT